MNITRTSVWAGIVSLCLAEAASAGIVTIQKVEATAYESLPAYEQSHERSTAIKTMKAPEGKVLLWVVATLQVQWDENTPVAKVDVKTTGLFAGDKKLTAAGWVVYTGVPFQSAAAGLLHRPLGWNPDKPPSPSIFQQIYVVPKDSKELTFKYDDASVAVAMPKQVSTIDLAVLADIKIKDAKIVDSVDFKVGGTGANMNVSNPGGKIAVVKITLTPKTGNVPEDANRFVWSSDWLALDLGKGLRIASVGEDCLGRLDYGTHCPNRNRTDKSWPGEDATLYFAVPADATHFTLTMLGAAMVKGTLGK